MRNIALLVLVIFVVGCPTNRNLRMSVDEFKNNYATDRIIFEHGQDYRTIHRKLFQAMRDCYSQPGFASPIIFGSSPNMGVSGEVYEDIEQAQIIYGINRPAAGQQKDVYVEMKGVTPTSARIEIYSWNTNVVDADKIAKSIKPFIQGDTRELYRCNLNNEHPGRN